MIDTSNKGNANYPVAPTPFDDPIEQPQMQPHNQYTPQYNPNGQPMDMNQGNFNPQPQYDPTGQSITDNSMASPFIPGDEEPSNLVSKLSQNARIGFIRKVYGIFCVQLLVTAAIVGVAINIEGLEKTLAQPAMLALFFISMALNLSSCIALCCCRKVARKVPINYILLGVFTLTESFML